MTIWPILTNWAWYFGNQHRSVTSDENRATNKSLILFAAQKLIEFFGAGGIFHALFEFLVEHEFAYPGKRLDVRARLVGRWNQQNNNLRHRYGR